MKKAQGSYIECCHHKKLMRPSLSREMSQRGVQDKGTPIHLTCAIFSAIETGYCCEADSNCEKKLIANRLIR
jgi:hypothetical protein